MSTDITTFTHISSLGGGMLIGLAAAILMIFGGRIAGISGILGGLLKPRRKDIGWRAAFIAGLITAPVIYSLFSDLPSIEIAAHPAVIIIAGLLVGFGTRYGSGCTSGHGVCGISRLSPRSIIATLIFITTAMITAFLA